MGAKNVVSKLKGMFHRKKDPPVVAGSQPPSPDSGLMNLTPQIGVPQDSGQDATIVDVTPPPQDSAASDELPAGNLTPQEQRKLNKRKGSQFQRLLDKVHPMQMGAGDENPAPQQPTGALSKVIRRVDAVGKRVNGFAADSIDMAGNDAVGADLAGLAGDTIDGLNIGSAISSSITLLVNTGKYVMSIVKLIQKYRKSRTVGREEIAEQIKEFVELIFDGLKAATDIMSVFKSLASKVPIVGAVIGGCSAAWSFACNCISLIKSSKSVHRMKKQKEAAKASIRASQGQAGYVVERHSKLNVFGIGTPSLHFDPEAMGRVDLATRGGNGPTRTRRKRVDEATTEMEQRGQESEAELMGALEEYDVTKELTGANEKRLRDSLTSIVLDDALDFAGSLAELDPTGTGSAVALSLSLAKGVGKVSKAGIVGVRRMGRNRNWSGFDANKSDANKLRRRHTLAVTMFKGLKGLAAEQITAVDPNTQNPEEVSKVRGGLGKYRMMSHRVDALGVGYGQLMRANDAREMIETIRGGFYRDA